MRLLRVAVTLARVFLYVCSSFKIYDDEHYETFLNQIQYRKKGVPLITVSNHRSVLDDPCILGSILPVRVVRKKNKMLS